MHVRGPWPATVRGGGGGGGGGGGRRVRGDLPLDEGRGVVSVMAWMARMATTRWRRAGGRLAVRRRGPVAIVVRVAVGRSVGRVPVRARRGRGRRGGGGLRLGGGVGLGLLGGDLHLLRDLGGGGGGLHLHRVHGLQLRVLQLRRAVGGGVVQRYLRQG